MAPHGSFAPIGPNRAVANTKEISSVMFCDVDHKDPLNCNLLLARSQSKRIFVSGNRGLSMSTKKYLSIVAWFTLALVGAQYAWAQQVQDVNIVDQQGQVKVKIKNGKGNPVPTYNVDAPGVELFQKSLDFDFDPSAGGGARTFAVPPGKRLVIEFISAMIFIEQGRMTNFSISAYVNGNLAPHRLMFNEVSPWGIYASAYNVSQSLKVHADPAQDVLVGIGGTQPGDGVAHISISGYLVDVP